jgi:Uma2 family endonuclease
MTLFSWRPDPKTYAEFLDFVAERPDEERWELVDGEFVMQASPTEFHQIIVANTLTRLGRVAAKRGPDCRAIPGVTVRVDHVDTYAPVPDVILRCGAPTRGATCSDPIVVVEVLSPSTMDRDRGFKTQFYKVVPSVLAFLIIYSDEARVEVWERGATETGFAVVSGASGIVKVASVGLEIPLAAVYEGTGLAG